MLNAELKVPPSGLVLAFAIGMWLVSVYGPSLMLTVPWRVAVVALLVVVGIAISLAGVLEFRRAKTTVNPLTPETTTAMVTSGVYRFSRNPMYLGFLLVLTGWAVFLAHALAFLFLPFFVVYMNRFQITPEERALVGDSADSL